MKELTDTVTEYAFYRVPIDQADYDRIPDNDRWLYDGPFRTFRSGEPEGTVRSRFAQYKTTEVGTAKIRCRVHLMARTAYITYTDWTTLEKTEDTE